jgi:WD40 repeat protein
MSPDGAAATCVATLAGHSNCVFAVAFDPTGRFVATGSSDKTAKVWK